MVFFFSFLRGDVQTAVIKSGRNQNPFRRLVKMLANYLVPCYIHTSFSCRFLSWCHREEFLSVCDLQANNDILAFLSGMPVTRNTKYLDLKNAVSHWTVILQTHHTSCVACFLFFFLQWFLFSSAPLELPQKLRLVQ